MDLRGSDERALGRGESRDENSWCVGDGSWGLRDSVENTGSSSMGLVLIEGALDGIDGGPTGLDIGRLLTSLVGTYIGRYVPTYVSRRCIERQPRPEEGGGLWMPV